MAAPEANSPAVHNEAQPRDDDRSRDAGNSPTNGASIKPTNSGTKTNGKASFSPVRKVADLHAMKEFFFSIEQWDNIDWKDETEDKEDISVLIGTSKNPVIRRGTKNLIEAPEKTFKTTFGLRLFIGLASGYTVYPSLPVLRSARVLYIHGEMTPQELKERRDAAQAGIPTESLTMGKKMFIDGRSIDAHLIRETGRVAIQRIVNQIKPDVLVIDPWQSFISGSDENSFQHMSQAMEFLDKLLVEMNGMTLFIIEHLGKDHSKGMRGHSSMAGWRDTLFRLKKKQGADGKIEVNVRPRWAAPLTFGVKFHNGTMVEGEAFSAQSAKIRGFVEQKGGFVPRADIETFLGGDKKTAQKAIQRAVQEEAIAEGSEENKGKFAPFLDLDDI